MERENAQQVDKNLIVENLIKEPDVHFYDVRQEPFTVYGLYRYREEPEFKRMPDDVAERVSDGVKALYRDTAGGRVRFSTDSQYIAIKAEMPRMCLMPHMSFVGSAGFDLYIDDPETGKSRFWRSFMPPIDAKDGYCSKIKFQTRKIRHFTVHFPSYSRVSSLYVGLQQDALLSEGMPYRKGAPIVYYGSSITQGACSSRPGNSYQNMVSRELGEDYINLGFSGNARAEEEIVRYIAGLEMSLFVCDYDHNSPSPEFLAETHSRVYRAVRAAHPDIPILLVSRPDMDGDNYEANCRRREVVEDTYRAARESGDRNVWYVDGAEMFRGPFECSCTVDGVHPNDLGFSMMANAITAAIRRARTQQLIE